MTHNSTVVTVEILDFSIPRGYAECECVSSYIRELGKALAHAAYVITGLADIIDEATKFQKEAAPFLCQEAPCRSR